MMPQTEPLRSALETRYADPSASKPAATLARESVAAAPDLEVGAPLSDLLNSIAESPVRVPMIGWCASMNKPCRVTSCPSYTLVPGTRRS